MSNLEVAETILAQLGGRRFSAMTGARNFRGDASSLTFDVGRNARGVHIVRIALLPSDTYLVTFFGRRGGQLAAHSDVYAEDLRRIFEAETELYTSLGTASAAGGGA